MVKWSYLIDEQVIGDDVRGPSNDPMYANSLWNYDYVSPEEAAVETDWEGNPIMGLEAYDVSNAASGDVNIVVCGHCGIKHYDSTNLSWIPMNHFDGYTPFADTDNADDYWGSVFTDLIVIDATNGDKDFVYCWK